MEGQRRPVSLRPAVQGADGIGQPVQRRPLIAAQVGTREEEAFAAAIVQPRQEDVINIFQPVRRRFLFHFQLIRPAVILAFSRNRPADSLAAIRKGYVLLQTFLAAVGPVRSLMPGVALVDAVRIHFVLLAAPAFRRQRLLAIALAFVRIFVVPAPMRIRRFIRMFRRLRAFRA